MANGEAVSHDLFDDSPITVNTRETLIARAERIDAMARDLILEVGKFRAQLEAETRGAMHTKATSRTATDADMHAAKAHPIKSCLTYFDTKHQKKFDGAPATFNGGQDAATMKRLIAQHTEDGVRTLTDQFFEDDDEWLRRTGYTVSNFAKRIPGLISSSRLPARAIGNTVNTSQNGRHSVAAADMIKRAYGTHGH